MPDQRTAEEKAQEKLEEMLAEIHGVQAVSGYGKLYKIAVRLQSRIDRAVEVLSKNREDIPGCACSVCEALRILQEK